MGLHLSQGTHHGAEIRGEKEEIFEEQEIRFDVEEPKGYGSVTE
jgi:hypothetical protein